MSDRDMSPADFGTKNGTPQTPEGVDKTDILMDDVMGDVDNYDDTDPEENLDYGDDVEPKMSEEEPAPKMSEEEKAAAEKELEEANKAEETEGAKNDEQKTDKTDGEPEPEDNKENKQAAAEKPKLKQVLIPKSRLDQEVARKHEALAELAKMREQVEASKGKLNGDALSEALGKLQNEEATPEEVMNELMNTMATQVAMAKEELRLEAKEDLMHESEQKDFMDAVVDLQDSFPFFDPADTENFDQKMTDEVVAIRDTYVQQGYPQGDALRKAARMVIADQKPELLYEVQKATEAPAKTPEQTLSTQSGGQTTASAKDTGRKVAAAAQQPPKVSGVSGEDTSIDVENMPEADFDALPESKKAELRGDLVA